MPNHFSERTSNLMRNTGSVEHNRVNNLFATQQSPSQATPIVVPSHSNNSSDCGREMAHACKIYIFLKIIDSNLFLQTAFVIIRSKSNVIC